MRKRRPERGFTLLELMVVAALIAVLAAVAIPAFFSDSRKSKSKSEVGPIFNDLRTRMDQYFQENGKYPTTIGEGTLWPTTPSTTKQSITTSMPTAWTTLKVRISNNSEVYCGYTWATGLPNDSANVGTVAAAAPFSFTAPATAWYYLFARCNMDGSSTTDSYYFSSSVDPTIVVKNEGN